MNQHGYVESFTEKPQIKESDPRFINTGVYLFEPHVLERIPSGRPVSLEREIFPWLLKNGGKLAAYTACDYWMDIGTQEKYLQLHKDIFDGKYRILDKDFSHDAIWGQCKTVGRNSKVQGPAYIGKNVRIGSGVVIGPYVCIDDGCHVEESLLWRNSMLKKNTYAYHTIITSRYQLNLSHGVVDIDSIQDIMPENSKRRGI